jgi:hypothetical protein
MSYQTIVDSMQFGNRYRAAYNDMTDDSYGVVNATCARALDDAGNGDTFDFNNFDNPAFDFDAADAGAQLTVVSTDVADTTVTIQLLGLDANKDYLTEIVVLNGTTPVQTTSTFTRLNALLVMVGPSVGTVSIDGLGFQWGKLAPGDTNLYAGRYSVARNFSFVPETSAFFADKTGEYKVAIFQKFPGIPAIEAFSLYLYRGSGEFTLYPTATSGPSDVFVRVTKLSGNGSLYVSGIFNGLIFDENQIIPPSGRWDA